LLVLMVNVAVSIDSGWGLQFLHQVEEGIDSGTKVVILLGYAHQLLFDHVAGRPFTHRWEPSANINYFSHAGIIHGSNRLSNGFNHVFLSASAGEQGAGQGGQGSGRGFQSCVTADFVFSI